MYAIPREQIVPSPASLPDEARPRRHRPNRNPQQEEERDYSPRVAEKHPSRKNAEAMAQPGGDRERSLATPQGSSIQIDFWKLEQNARRNQETPIKSLKRTLTLESWLRYLTTKQIIGNRGQVTAVKGMHIHAALRKPKSLAS